MSPVGEHVKWTQKFRPAAQVGGDGAPGSAPSLPARPPLRRWGWLVLHSSLLGASLPSCAANTESSRTGEVPVPTLGLVPQRVTATVTREALRLVRLETEHDALLTTPEHPFATPRSGWTHAARLLPGDWVVSERFGAVRLSSVRNEPAPRPVPVFNLSVAASHAYFVGTARVLVHNTKCQPGSSRSDPEVFEQTLRQRDELTLRLTTLKRTTPKSPEVAELIAQRNQLNQWLRRSRSARQKEQGIVHLSKPERSRRHHEADLEGAQKSLEAAQKQLAELETRLPTSTAERVRFAEDKEKLEKQIAASKLSYDRTSQILTWLRELEAIERASPTNDADRQALEERKRALHADLYRERVRASALKYTRRKRSRPEARQARTKYERDRRRRLLQLPAHLDDSERPRDTLEHLQGELASQLQQSHSDGRDARIHHLTDQIETLKKSAERGREHQSLTKKRNRLQPVRDRLSAAGEDTSEVDQQLESLDRQIHATKVELDQLRLRNHLLTRLDDTPWPHAPLPVDEAQLQELERQLAEGIIESERQVVDVERAPVATQAPDFDWQEDLLAEAFDVDELLAERDELMGQSPSPERATRLQSSSERLQQELREERAALEVAQSALVNEYAHVQTTQAGSSSGSGWLERLGAIQEEQTRLNAQWRARLQARLDRARQELHLLLSIERFRDEQVEAELAREVALLERELRTSG